MSHGTRGAGEQQLDRQSRFASVGLGVAYVLAGGAVWAHVGLFSALLLIGSVGLLGYHQRLRRLPLVVRARTIWSAPPRSWQDDTTSDTTSLDVPPAQGRQR